MPKPSRVPTDGSHLYENANIKDVGYHPIQKEICVFTRKTKLMVEELTWLPNDTTQNQGENGAQKSHHFSRAITPRESKVQDVVVAQFKKIDLT